MLTARLVLRALRWRAGAAACVFVVAAIAVAAAALGPMYLRAVDGGVLRQTLDGATRLDRDVTAQVDSSPSERGDWAGAVQDMLSPVAGSRWFVSAITFASTEIELVLPRRGSYDSRLMHASGDCAHLQFVAGRCPNGPGEIAVSVGTRDAGAAIGDDIDAALTDSEQLGLHVVGVYQPIGPTGDYWGGTHFFDAAPTNSDKQLPRLDSFVVAASMIGDLTSRVPVTYGGDARLAVRAVHVSDTHQIGQLVEAANARATAHQADGGTIVTALPSLLDQIAAEQRVPRTLVVVACVQLALLALVVLGAIVWSTADAQVDEAALARLRGRRLGSVVVLAVAQPAVAVVLAFPVGLVAAWGVAGALSPTLVGDGGVAELTSNAVWLGAAVAATGIAVCVAAVGRAFLASVASLFHRAAPSARAPVARMVAEAVVLTVAVVAVVELETHGLASSDAADKPDALAILVPTFLAAGAAVAMLHLVPLAARPLIALTRDRTRVGAFIAVRQLVRRDTALRLSAVVAVATSVAVFAAASWSNATRNRELRAWGDVGAAQVLTVQPKSGVDLVSAVRSADPSGHEAMAVESHVGAATPIVAVDSQRLPGIAAWVGANSQYPLRQIAGWLSPHLPAPTVLTGTHVRLRAVVEELPQQPVHLVLLASDREHRQVQVDLGQPRLGVTSYTGALSPDCARGCRLAGLTVAFPEGTDIDPTAPTPVSVIRYLGIEISNDGSGYSTVEAGLTESGRWQGKSADQPVPQPEGLEVTLRYNAPTASWGAAVPDDLPLVLPAVVASDTLARSFVSPTSTLDVAGLDGSQVTVDGTVPAVSLPGLGRSGVMVDLTLARRAQTSSASAGTASQVWLAPDAPAALLGRLRAAGLSILDDETAAARQRVYDHSGPTYGTQMFLVMAGVAGMLGAGVVLALGLISARRRAYDYASLRVIGVRERMLRRAVAAELAAAVLVGLLVGIGSGLGGTALATHALPLFVDANVGLPTVSSVPWPPVVALCGGLVVVLAAVCVAVVAVVRRNAGIDRLREGTR
jgi:hypothetical protein